MGAEDLHVGDSSQPFCLSRPSVGTRDVIRNYDFHADARANSMVDERNPGDRRTASDNLGILLRSKFLKQEEKLEKRVCFSIFSCLASCFRMIYVNTAFAISESGVSQNRRWRSQL
jgi:hypothetical protein